MAQPGFIDIVEDPLLVQGLSTGIGILAQTPGALDRIERAMDVQWQLEDSFMADAIDRAIDIDARLADQVPSHSIADDKLATDKKWDVDLRLDVPLAPHHAIEPRAAVARFDSAGSISLWVGSQDHFYIRDVIAKRLDLDADKVRVQPMRVGGGFGGKTLCTVELEAAVLARASGQPVKMQWTRQQELNQAFHRPPSSHRVRVRLNNGQVDDWWHAFASGHIIFTNAGLPAWLQRVADFIGDMGVARGADMPYRAARRCIQFDQVRLPALTGPWRGLGAGPNCLAIESAMDECARQLDEDPVAFRQRHIQNPRLSAVLDRVAQASQWQSRPPGGTTSANECIGHGVACGIYKETSYAAVVARVSVGASGAVTVRELFCSHDCGLVINPDQVVAQCEGNLVWGLGMVLSDSLPMANGGYAATNFDGARVPRFSQMPTVSVELVDSDGPPSGAGETAIVAAAAAIANAIRDATGYRIERFPIQSEQLKLSA